MDERTEIPDEDAVARVVPGDDNGPATDLAARAAQHTQDLLAEHVPLALLVDLVNAAGPESEELLVTEGLPEVEWWRSSDGEQQPSA